MSEGPRMPEMGTPERDVVDKRGGAVRALSAMFRTWGADENTKTEGRAIKRNTEAFNQGKKLYVETTAGRGDAASKEAARTRLVDAAKELVRVTDATPDGLTSEEQRYVDAVIVASAQRVVETMPRTIRGGENPWRLGSSLQRAERFREQQPNVNVVRTPEGGLQVMVTTGAGGAGPDGAVQFSGSAPFTTIDSEGERIESTDDQKNATQINVRQYNFKRAPGTGGAPGRIEGMTITDRGGVSQQSSVIDNGNDGFASVQQTIESASVGHQTYYQQSGELQVRGQSYDVRVVSQAPGVTMDQAREEAQTYIENGGVITREIQPDGGEKQVITLFVGTPEERQRVFPQNPDGIHISGIMAKDQINVEPAEARAQRKIASAEDVRIFAEQLREPGFVSQEAMSGRFTDPVAPLAAISGISAERTRDVVDTMVRQQRALLQTRSVVDAQRDAFSTVLNQLRTQFNASGRALTRNEATALWHAAELIATQVDASYIPNDADLSAQASALAGMEEGAPSKKSTDISYLINRTNFDATIKSLLIQELSENATNRTPSNLDAILREAIRTGKVRMADLDPISRARLEGGENLPTKSGAAVTRLFQEPPYDDEDPGAYRARMESLATSLGFDNPDARGALVAAAMRSHRMDAASRREAATQAIANIERTGRVSEASLRILREAQTFGADESVTMGGVMSLAESLPPTVVEQENPNAYRTRIEGIVSSLNLPDSQAAGFTEMVLALNSMDAVSIDARTADRLLLTYGADADNARGGLPANMYMRYLSLTHAPAEDVLREVSTYVSENPRNLGQLRELSRDYPALVPVVDGLLYSAFAREFSPVEGENPESAEDRRNRLVARAGELSGLASNPAEMRRTLLAMVPPIVSTDAAISAMRGMTDDEVLATAVQARPGLLTRLTTRGR